MKKAASNARWSGLSPENLQTLENWLFDAKLTYPCALERARRELGFTGSPSSLKRFYQRRSRERTVQGFREVCFGAETITQAPGDTALLRAAAMKMVGRLFLSRITETPEAVKDWEPLARLLLQSEDNELRRQMKSEENTIRRECLKFAQERFHYNVIEEAQKILPQLEALAEARKDPDTQFFDQSKYLNGMLRTLFGDTGYFHPENLAEAEAQAKAAAAGGRPLAPHVMEYLNERAARAAIQKNATQQNHPVSSAQNTDGPV
ncbi:MAG: hypothetical protein JWQ04_28 [Pedosphaera sp.]|nr:hypothetical protein [Pedosphaera sp.]